MQMNQNFAKYTIALILFAHAHAVTAAEPSRTNAFNPDISVNFLGLFERGTQLSGDPSVSPHNGFNFQESEVQFMADVDPYFRANVLFSVAPNAEGEFGIDPEAVYFESLSLPIVTLKAGKFKAAISKHNTLHTHAFPFIDAPLINQALLGDEGMNEFGVSGAALIPALPWYSEVTLQVLTSSNEALWGTTNSGDLGLVANLNNLWDLSDSTTLGATFFGASGKNDLDLMSNLIGADLSIKWRPVAGGKYHALNWTAEYLKGHRGGKDELGGLATWLQFQFAERWWAQARAEFEGLPHSEGLNSRTKQSALLGFFPSEFSGFRIQYDRLAQAAEPLGHTVALQWNITIGAHPAHAY